MSLSKIDLITVLGPTASGKTALAVKIARQLNSGVISADSRQVYRGMDTGTGKDLFEYGEIKYHLIDIIDVKTDYSVFDFRSGFDTIFRDYKAVNKTPVLCGGTGLYLSSVLQDYKMAKLEDNQQEREQLNSLSSELLKEKLFELNEQLHNTTDLLSKERTIQAILTAEANKKNPYINYIKPVSLTIGIAVEREKVKERIKTRLLYRINNGLIEEVEQLINSGISHERLNYFGLEYRFTAEYLRGELSYDNYIEKLFRAIAGFAKRQMTWFRRMEKQGVNINWIQDGNYDDVKNILFSHGIVS